MSSGWQTSPRTATVWVPDSSALACATTTGSLSAYTTRQSALTRCAISCTF